MIYPGEFHFWIEPIQGKRFNLGLEPISVIQTWLEEKNPHYLHALPSIIAQLDLTRISNYIDHKGTVNSEALCIRVKSVEQLPFNAPANLK